MTFMELLLSAKLGSTSAFEELFARYKNLLRKYSVVNGMPLPDVPCRSHPKHLHLWNGQKQENGEDQRTYLFLRQSPRRTSWRAFQNHGYSLCRSQHS